MWKELFTKQLLDITKGLLYEQQNIQVSGSVDLNKEMQFMMVTLVIILVQEKKEENLVTSVINL